MALLSPTLLEGLGIKLDEQSYAMLEEHFETTLNERVINEIILELTPEQAEGLAALENASDEQIIEWLTTNVPDVAEIVAEEIDILLGELADNSEAIAES